MEALAVTQAIKKWRVYIKCSAETTMVTDHKTLTRLLAQKPGDDLSNRQVGWVETLMPLANRLRLLYRKGSHNEADPEVDLISRQKSRTILRQRCGGMA